MQVRITLLVLLALTSAPSIAQTYSLGEIQQELLRRGFIPGNTYGVADDATLDALVQFQIKSAIFPSDGQIDRQTLVALFQNAVKTPLSDVVIVEQPELPSQSDTVVRPGTRYRDSDPKPNTPSWWTIPFDVTVFAGGSYSKQDFGQVLGVDGTSLSPGTGFQLGGLIGGDVPKTNLRASLSIAYRQDADSRTDGSNKFSRYPLGLGLAWTNGIAEIGGGILAHLSPQLDFPAAGGANSDYSVSASPGYFFFYRQTRAQGRPLFIQLSYENITYDIKSHGRSISGNSLGVSLGWKLY